MRVRSFRTRPQVSIVVATLNRGRWLDQLLQSLASLRYPDFEVVVVNGPSQDDTEEVLARHAKAVRILECPVASTTQSRNIGIDAAQGEIIAFIDDDAVPSPKWLDHLVRAFDDERVGGVGGPVFDIPLGRVEWSLCTCTRSGVPDTSAAPPIGQYVHVGADPFAYLAGCNMAFRRSALQAIGGFNAAITHVYDDVDICCALIDHGMTLRYADKALVRHERAPSALRDSQQRITDHYNIVRSRTILALHHAIAPKEQAIELLTQWADELAAALVQSAADDNEATWHRERVTSGLAEGIAVGSLPRPFHSVTSTVADHYLRHPSRRRRGS